MFVKSPCHIPISHGYLGDVVLYMEIFFFSHKKNYNTNCTSICINLFCNLFDVFRSKMSEDIMPPLPNNNPLLQASEAVTSQQPTTDTGISMSNCIAYYNCMFIHLGQIKLITWFSGPLTFHLNVPHCSFTSKVN